MNKFLLPKGRLMKRLSLQIVNYTPVSAAKSGIGGVGGGRVDPPTKPPRKPDVLVQDNSASGASESELLGSLLNEGGGNSSDFEPNIFNFTL